MMNRFKFFYAGAWLMLLTACTASDDATTVKSDSEPQPLLLTASQSDGLVSRASDGLYTASTGFDGGETVKVFLGDQSATYSVGTPDATNDNKSALTPTAERLFYPTGTSGTAQVYAVYPAASATAHTVAYDQTSDAAYKASDLMYAKQTVSLSNKTSQQTLTFNHQLVKMAFIITKAVTLPAVTKIEMKNVKRKSIVTATASDLTLSNLASADGDDAEQGDNILVSGTITDAEPHTCCVVFPAQAWDDTDFVEVTIGERKASYKVTKNNWTPGAKYAMTLTVLNDNGEISLIQSDITDWDCVEIVQNM